MTDLERPPAAVRAEDGDDEIDLAQLIDLLVGGKWIILAATVIAVAAGALYAFTAQPIYRGDILLQVEKQQASIPGLSELMGGEKLMTSAEVELLRSRMVAGKVVDQLDLAISVEPVADRPFARLLGGGPGPRIQVGRLEVPPHLVGTEFILEAQGEGLFELRVADTDRALGTGRVGKPLEVPVSSGKPRLALFVVELQAEPGTRFRLVRESRLAAIARIHDDLEVTERGGRRGESGILEVSLEHPDPVHIRRVLDTLGNSYVRQNVERRSAEAARSLEFLQEQLPQLRTELESAEQVFNEFRRQNQSVDLDAESGAMLDRLVEVESQLSKLQVEEASLRLQFGSDHPRMRALANQRQSLGRVRAEIEQQVTGLPERQQQLLRLRREVEVNTALYTSLMNTAQELRVAQAGTIGNVRVIDDAAVGPKPVRPRKTRILLLSLLLGGMLGVGVVFFRQALRRGITDPDAAEKSLGLPVYAVFPHSPLQRRYERQAKRSGRPIEILAESAPEDVVVESLRSLRTSLNFALMGDTRNVVILTSPGPGNGKTFLTMNFGCVLAQGLLNVLIIDADMRRGHVNAYVQGRARSPGLSEVLSGQVRFEDALVRRHARRKDAADPAGRVDLLRSGTFPPNPSELLMRPEFGQLIELQRQRYDLVIIDTPPILPVTDGVIVAAQAGPVFMVVRARQTTLREAQVAIRRLEHNRIKLSGLLINDLDASREGHREYHYHYNYAKRTDA
jgi:tyrosine-protein kinase Etk/Wzc